MCWRKVSLSLQPRLKATLECLEKAGVVSKVTKPTDWVNSLVIVEKKDKSLRLSLDPRDINKYIKIEYHRTPSVEKNLQSSQSKNKRFSLQLILLTVIGIKRWMKKIVSTLYFKHSIWQMEI